MSGVLIRNESQSKREGTGSHRPAFRVEKTDNGFYNQIKRGQVWEIYLFDGCVR